MGMVRQSHHERDLVSHHERDVVSQHERDLAARHEQTSVSYGGRESVARHEQTSVSHDGRESVAHYRCQADSAADATPLVVVEGVSKAFPRVQALCPIEFSIRPGERVALVGPSGSGKTTLLNLLSGIEQPDAGSLSIGGRCLSQKISRRELSRLVGLIHQQYDLVPQLPVVHNVLAGRFGRWGIFRSALSLVWPQDYAVARTALERMGIADKIQERTSHLSGGEQQRVAIARTIVQSPRLVLADEPVASLDPARAEEILRLLADLTSDSSDSNNSQDSREPSGDSGKTLIASIHSTELIRRFFSRAIGLREGQLQFDIPASELTPAALNDLYELNDDDFSHHLA